MLEQCAQASLRQLKQPDGFMRIEKVRIPLPEHLHDASRMLKSTGYGRSVEELVLAMNRVAERGIGPLGALLTREIAQLAVPSPQALLHGGAQAVTAHFASASRTRLLPPVKAAQQVWMEKTGVVDKYNRVAGRMVQLGLSSTVGLDLPQYLAGKTLDGVFMLMQDEEARLRAPADIRVAPPPQEKAHRPIYSPNPG